MHNEEKPILVQIDDSFGVEEAGQHETIRRLSAVPVDLKKLLAEIEAEENRPSDK